MNKKFIYFKTKTQFTAKLSSLPKNAIVFIEDTKQIWTHGVFFDTLWGNVEGIPTGTKALIDAGTDTVNRVWSSKTLGDWLSGKVYTKNESDNKYALKTISITGTGDLTGGGNLSSNRTIDLTTAIKADIAKGVTANSWGNHAGKYASQSLSGGSNTVSSADTRSVNELPTTNLKRGVSFDFKTRTVIGMPKGGTYASAITMASYSDDSGNSGSAFRLAQSSNNLMFQNYTTGTWGTWNEIYHSGNFTPSNYLPLTGGTLTGNLNVNGYITSQVDTFTGTYPVAVNVSGRIYANDKVKITGSTGNLEANSFIKTGGTSSQLLLANGGVKNVSDFATTDTTYLEIPTSEIGTSTSSTLRTITGRRVTDILNVAKGYVDNIEIGGRNLLYKGMYEFGTGSPTMPIGTTYEELKIGSGVTRIRTKELIKIDGNYIIKLHNKDYRFLLYLFDENKGYLGQSQGEIFWRRDDYIIPDRAKYIAVLIDKNNTVLTLNDFDDAKLKLERGNKATDWTPAPEDQVSDWNETNTSSYSYIKNKPFWIGASKPTYAFSEITGTASVAQIPNLDAGKITSGIFNIARIPTGTTSTTVALGNHTHAYLPLSGGKLTGDLEIFAGNTDKFIKFFAYNTTDAYAWRIGYLGTGVGNENRLVFQSAKTSGASYVDALSFGLDDLVGKFAVTPTVGNTKVSLEGHNHTLKLIAGTSTATVDSTVDVADPYIRLFSDNVHQGNIRIVGGTNVGAVSKAGTITLTATDTTYTAGSNITINSNNVIAGNYPSLTKALLDAGSATTQSVATPQVLASWLDGKIESKVDKSDWSDSYNIPSSLFLNRTSWIRIGKFTSSYKANPTILNFRASSGNGGYGGSCIISLSGNNTTGKDIFVSVLNQTNATTFRKIRVIRKESNWYGDAYIDVELRSGSSGVSVSYQESLPKGGIEFTTPIELGADYLPSGYVEDVYELDKAYFEDIATQGVYKKGSSNSYLLLGGGGHKAISDFNASLVTSTTAAGISNVATSNTNTYLNIVQGGASIGSSTRITGSGSVTVSSDVNGVLTINGVNTDTTYTTGTLAQLNAGNDTTGRLQTAKLLNDWLNPKLALKATQSDIDTAIDNLEIGGRNLVLNSKDFQIGYSGSGISRSITEEGYLQVVAEVGNGNYVSTFLKAGYGTLLNNGFLKQGDLITVSMEVKSPNSTGVPTLYLKEGYGYNQFKGTLSDKFSKISFTTTWREANNLNLHLGFSGLVGTYIFKNIKIEKGNKATDWTPAPEDQVSDWSESNITSFSYIKNKPTQLSQFIDNIGVGTHIANKANPHNVTTAQIGAVDLTTNQTITGAKTFNANITLGKSNYIVGTDRYAGVWNVDDLLWRFGSSKAGSVTNIRSEKVGIGTDSPSYKLDVSGTGRFTGNVTAPNFVGNLSGLASLNLPLTGGTLSGGLNTPNIGVNSSKANDTGNGISLYGDLWGGSGVLPRYGLAFSGTTLFETHGAVTGDWATYLTMDGATNRGWIFKRGTGSSGNAASISSLGVATFNGSVTAPTFIGALSGNASSASSIGGLGKENLAKEVHYGTTSSPAGYYKVKILPATSWMTSFTIRVYQGYNMYDITISGYNYAGNYWYSPKATLSNSSVESIPISFGYDSAYNLWVAFPSSSYAGITVINANNGYTQVADFGSKFTIIHETALTGTVQTTITANTNILGNAATATALTTNAGSATQPVYFSGGKPVATTYSLGASVPSNAIFTDTTYSNFTKTVAGLVPAPTGSTSTRFLREDGTWHIPTDTEYTAGTGISLNNKTFSLNTATASALGGVKLGSDTVQTGTTKVYGVQLNSSGQMVVSVPWTDTNTNTTYSAGNGLTLSGTTFSLPITTSGTGDYVKSVVQTANGLTVTLDTPPNTTYSAGTGLSLSTTTFNVNYGTTSGTAAQGNDSRINNGQTAYGWGNHANVGYLTSVPLATTSVIGGGYLANDTKANVTLTRTTTANRYYPIQLNTSNELMVNVPWTDTTSSYSLPIATANALGGIRVGTNLSINSSTGVLTATDTKYSAGSNISISGSNVISATNTTYSDMSASEITAGTATTSRTITSKVLNDWLNNKGFITSYIDTTYSGSTSVILSGGTFQRAALTGDVTASANSNATTIANSAVTYAKIQDVPTNTILGRVATGTGAIKALSISEVKDMLNVSEYTLPTATSTGLGGVKLFSNTTQTVAASSVTSTSSRTYGIQTNSSGQLVVNVPWTDTNTTYHTGTLTELKNNSYQSGQLWGTGALNDWVDWKLSSFSMPSHTHTASDITGIASSRLLGRYSSTSGAVQTISIGSGLTLSTSGVLSASSSSYTHPTGDGNLHVPATGTTNNGKVLMAGSTAGSLSWGTPPDTTYTAGTAANLTASSPSTTNMVWSPSILKNNLVGKTGAQTMAGPLSVTGTITGSKLFRNSDILLKTNINNLINQDLTNLDKIDLVSFNWKKSGNLDFGIIAQDVEKYYPNLINIGTDGFKKVDYESFYALKIARLEQRIKELEDKLWQMN